MPTLTIDRKEFEKLLDKKISLDTLKDRISMLGTDLEEINDDEIVVEIFPNRPDMLSMQGFARALSSFIGVKKGLRKYEIKDSKEKVIVEESVKDIRPYTACAIVKNLHFDDETIKEIIQLQEKLHVTYGRNRKKAAIGIYPCEKIKFPIRFMALKPEEIKFQPLEFNHELNGNQIIEKHPAGKEYGYLLKDLEKYPIFIDANNNILSMPPVINSHLTGKVSEETKEVFIECSGFDFNILKKCLNMIVTALSDMGGEIFSIELDYKYKTSDKKVISPNLAPEEMEIDLNYINKMLGLNLTEKQIQECLEKMGFDYDYKSNKVFVPAYRADILHPIDIVEDIAIAYGYENFEEVIPDVATIAQEAEIEKLKSKVIDFLVGFGFLETNTYNLINKEIQSTLMEYETDIIDLKNSVSTEYNSLRAWIIPSLMQVLKENKHHESPQNIFEIGTIFKKNEDFETNVEETQRLAVLLCAKDSDFTKIKQVLDALMSILELKYHIEDVAHNSFIPGRVARVSLNNKKVAYLGELHPKILENFGLEMPVAALELNISELFDIVKNKK
jgi:phenylalanyl-tRNA synthetase beta chain